MRQHGYVAIATVYCSSQLGGAKDLGEKRELALSNLFCPYPESNSLWIVIAEKLADREPLGRKISLFRSMAKALCPVGTRLTSMRPSAPSHQSTGNLLVTGLLIQNCS